MKAVIRAMTRRNKADVMSVVRATPEFNELDVATAEEVIDSFLEDPVCSGYHIQVAEIEGRVAGYVCYGPTPLTVGNWYVYWIAVAPGEKGKGIGSALLASAEERIKTAEGRLVLIETSGKLSYQDTRRFYERRGYRVASSIRDYYDIGDDRLTFEKRFE